MAWVVSWQHGSYVYPQPGGGSNVEMPSAQFGPICQFSGPIQTWDVLVAPSALQLAPASSGGGGTSAYPICG